MTGYLSSVGIQACERRVGNILRTVNPVYHDARRRVGLPIVFSYLMDYVLFISCQKRLFPLHILFLKGARNLNPTPYYAGYMGHKLHIDQNEKLCMFGVTHVMAVDGYSKRVVSHATMPIKNNLIIYENVYRLVPSMLMQ